MMMMAFVIYVPLPYSFHLITGISHPLCTYATCFAVISHCPQTFTSSKYCLLRFILQEMGMCGVWLHVEDKLDIKSCYLMLEIHT
jgi:hypothetical protein